MILGLSNRKVVICGIIKTTSHKWLRSQWTSLEVGASHDSQLQLFGLWSSRECGWRSNKEIDQHDIGNTVSPSWLLHLQFALVNCDLLGLVEANMIEETTTPHYYHHITDTQLLHRPLMPTRTLICTTHMLCTPQQGWRMSSISCTWYIAQRNLFN